MLEVTGGVSMLEISWVPKSVVPGTPHLLEVGPKLVRGGQKFRQKPTRVVSFGLFFMPAWHKLQRLAGVASSADGVECGKAGWQQGAVACRFQF
ncbi:hypothetical protein TorRG33x02_006490 [Trema orientale]|uniref:Uncharacterized protein n=1 Tax=Trema orientale TaxID=63057 RepID=A0A2P5G079_TREOI|nr:hypothetical protein TorRG33x02_006490 [Trema orientale]